VSDLLGAQIPLMFDPVQSVLQHVRSGKLRALAVSSAERSAVLPQVPTLNESGLKGFEATAWWAVFAPAGLPPAIATKLTADVRQVVETAAFRDRLLEVGVQTPSGPARPFAEFHRAELAKWGKSVRDSGVTLEQ
jgi:tripartite-type tricarboxylate transporter receptor subunit TctC